MGGSLQPSGGFIYWSMIWHMLKGEKDTTTQSAAKVRLPTRSSEDLYCTSGYESIRREIRCKVVVPVE